MSTARKTYYHVSLPDISQKVSKLKVMEMYSFPRQFILTNQLYSEYEYSEYIDIEELNDNKNEEENNEETNRLQLPIINMDSRSYTVTPDLDYMLPDEVRETLISEGLSRQVVERSLRTAEKRHRQALYLTIQQQKWVLYFLHALPWERERSFVNKHGIKIRRGGPRQIYFWSQKRCDEKRKQSNKLTLPLISPDTNNTSCLGCLETTSGCDICHNVDARRQSRHLRTRPWQERPQSPIADTDMTSQREEKESHKSTDVVTLYQTEIEKARWLSEQQLEKALVGTFFEPPRLVLVSSKIPKCQYIPKVLLEGEHVIYIVYDFDTWSFIDITDAIQKKLESIKSGCKAKSICLLCQGGPGYLYILRKYVITPQKLRKDSYKSVKEFWKALAGQISKLTPSESKIHILGCRMGETKQGTEVKANLQKLVHPNLVYVEAPNEETQHGKSVISLYFNSRRYNVWRSHFDDSDDEEIDFEAEEHALDETESIPRTWSSLANEVDSDND